MQTAFFKVLNSSQIFETLNITLAQSLTLSVCDLNP